MVIKVIKMATPVVIVILMNEISFNERIKLRL